MINHFSTFFMAKIGNFSHAQTLVFLVAYDVTKRQGGNDMVKGKLIPLVVTAFFIVVISLFSFSLMSSSPSEPTQGKVSADGSEEVMSDTTGNGGDSTITNNVDNHITGENADVNNTIDNNVKNGKDHKVDNHVSNNIEVNVDVNVTNDIGNNIEGSTSSSTNGSNNNGDDSQGESANNTENGKDSATNDTSNDEIVWGVDSASLTTSDMLACVRENFGEPVIWGRYVGEKEGVSEGITSEEVELLHSNDIKILPIWNHFEDATGYENGRNEAERAIAKAEELGIPDGVAIFADIEPNYPVDSEFIRGWHEVLFNSNYESGIYGVFDADAELTEAFEEAAGNNSSILERTYLWTAAPSPGVTSESNAPEYAPESPESGNVVGWQYGLDAESCNIDTNLFPASTLDILW